MLLNAMQNAPADILVGVCAFLGLSGLWLLRRVARRLQSRLAPHEPHAAPVWRTAWLTNKDPVCLLRFAVRELAEIIAICKIDGCDVRTLFDYACEFGYSSLVRWLVEVCHVDVTPAAVLGVFSYGDLAVASWLLERIDDDAAGHIDNVLQANCFDPTAPKIEWSLRTFGVCWSDCDINHALQDACGRGDHASVRQLLTNYSFPTADLVSAFLGAMADGHLDLAEWLVEATNICSKDVFGSWRIPYTDAPCPSVLRRALGTGDQSLVDRLIKLFGVDQRIAKMLIYTARADVKPYAVARQTAFNFGLHAEWVSSLREISGQLKLSLLACEDELEQLRGRMDDLGSTIVDINTELGRLRL